MEDILGYIERIIFHNEENGFTVARFAESEKDENICVVGTLPGIKDGETIKAYGSWNEDPKHGTQFVVESYLPQTPTTLIGIRKYLGGGHINGIGPTYAKRIIKKFGLDTLKILDDHPDRLLEVPGLGKKRLKKIKKHWVEKQTMRNALIFLQSHGISPTYAQKIFNIYGEGCFEKVKENPYQLTEIHGIGFKKADEIARNIGISLTSDKRVDAGIKFVLSELCNSGHVCYPTKPFLSAVSKTLDIVDVPLIENRIDFLEEKGSLIRQELLFDDKIAAFIWAKNLYNAEVGIAKEIDRLLNSPSYLRKIDAERALAWAEDRLHINFATQQREAIKLSLSSKMQIITGGPGTGKSTITRAIIGITKEMSKKILLAAPTGRAAKRMTEITGVKAQTIHSMLEADITTGLFSYNEDNRLSCDLIIIDEASMIDTSLMYHLLQAIPSTARVIFIGDINQLPSVGPGTVLKSMIQSQKIAVTTLDQIFRQGKNSKIVINAHNINKGIFPDTKHDHESDFFFIDSENPNEIVELISDLVAIRLPEKYSLHPTREIQVLTPMKKGILGTGNLNEVLQNRLNPQESAKKINIGDKVMQIKNNYQKRVFNGDIGYISYVNEDKKEFGIAFENKSLIYTFAELDEIILSYAVSVHKYQGSECPCIVMPVHTTHYTMLQRNLIYTAVTRGKQLVVLVGTKKALGIAVGNDKIRTRHSGLLQALTTCK